MIKRIIYSKELALSLENSDSNFNLSTEEFTENMITNPTPTYSEIAQEIIKTSIRSAICIDDSFVEPYMSQEVKDEYFSTHEQNLNEEIPSSLYKSFRADGDCDLDIYNFRSYEDSWKPNYMLNNKDLMILDWELDGENGYESTLKILKEVIAYNKIPFIIIYTYKPKSDFIQIANNLIQSFNCFSKKEIESELKRFYQLFEEHMIKVSSDKEWEEDSVQLFWENNDSTKLVNEFLFSVTNRDTTLSTLYSKISESFNISDSSQTEKKFKTTITQWKSNGFISSLEQLCYAFAGSNFEEVCEIKRIDTNDIGFRINNCVITIFSKPGGDGSGVSPENVFKSFSELITTAPHNFITLLSMEMRDRFREDFSIIGNEIFKLDERAFFKQMENYQSRFPDSYESQFYDFLLKSWINELIDYNINLFPKLFSVLAEYKSQDEKLKDIKVTDIKEHMAELSLRLTTSNIVNRFEKDKKIRFGDIFRKIKIEADGSVVETDEYFLSITPHCVCLDECKVDNNFYFIKSEYTTIDLTSAIKDMETQYYSFVKSKEGKILSLKWGECKPFTLYIEKNTIDNLNSVYKNQSIQLAFVTTLKENFAQRISNKAFSYGTSIGIDLPHGK